MRERRKYIRVKVSLRVTYQVLKSFRPITSYTRNISEGGLCLPIPQRLEPGILVECESYPLLFKEPIVVTGEVVWLKERGWVQLPFMIGVKFVNIVSKCQEQIRNYIWSKLNEEYSKSER